jgi:hypothetical protein
MIDCSHNLSGSVSDRSLADHSNSLSVAGQAEVSVMFGSVADFRSAIDSLSQRKLKRLLLTTTNHSPYALLQRIGPFYVDRLKLGCKLSIRRYQRLTLEQEFL